MELRHDAGGDESRDRYYRRWESLSAEMIHNELRVYRAAKNSGNESQIFRCDSFLISASEW